MMQDMNLFLQEHDVIIIISNGGKSSFQMIRMVMSWKYVLKVEMIFRTFLDLYFQSLCFIMDYLLLSCTPTDSIINLYFIPILTAAKNRNIKLINNVCLLMKSSK